MVAAMFNLSEPAALPLCKWQLQLFGTFRLVDPVGTPITLSSRKVEGLLAILAIEREHGVSRDKIAEILWPGRPLDVQRALFVKRLPSLNGQLGKLEWSLLASIADCRTIFPWFATLKTLRCGSPGALCLTKREAGLSRSEFGVKGRALGRLEFRRSIAFITPCRGLR
jgi:hypothetical protein